MVLTPKICEISLNESVVSSAHSRLFSAFHFVCMC